MNLELYFDGAVEPVNPGGHGSWGWVIKDAATGEAVETREGDLGRSPGMTNNIAEYSALEDGLSRVCDLYLKGLPRQLAGLTVFGDSQLALYQVTGRWKCNREHLRERRDRCRSLVELLKRSGVRVALQWIPRDRNAEADALSRLAWTMATGQPFPERRRGA
jgi:ribonuclease HI